MITWAVRIINSNKHRLTLQQYRTLIGQAKAGNPDAALKGLHKIIGTKIKGSEGSV